MNDKNANNLYSTEAKLARIAEDDKLREQAFHEECNSVYRGMRGQIAEASPSLPPDDVIERMSGVPYSGFCQDGEEKALAAVEAKSDPYVPLEVQSIPQLNEYLSPAAKDIHRGPSIGFENTVVEWIDKTGKLTFLQATFLGVSFELDNGQIPPSAVKALANDFNHLVEQKLIGWCCLATAMWLPLAALPGHKQRGLAIVYPFTDLGSDHLRLINEALDGRPCMIIDEGGTPPCMVTK